MLIKIITNNHVKIKHLMKKLEKKQLTKEVLLIVNEVKSH